MLEMICDKFLCVPRCFLCGTLCNKQQLRENALIALKHRSDNVLYLWAVELYRAHFHQARCDG